MEDRGDREVLFITGRADATRLSAEIKRTEDEINAIVCRLFDLTDDEIKLLESAIGVR